MPKYKLAFLGAGNMAQAIAKAAIDSGVLKPAHMIASDPAEPCRQAMADLGVTLADNNASVAKSAQQIMLAVKPQIFPKVAADLAAALRDDHILISIMAGVTTQGMASAIAKAADRQAAAAAPRIVRVMPNTPLQVGQGMSAIALGAGAQAGDDALAIQLFAAAGKAVQVSEDQLDAVTAVSGSGPAYLFYLAEAMQQAAADLGLAEHAPLLVSQTLLGAAKLLAESDKTPQDLRRQVTSSGGTTQAACEHLDQQNVADHIIDALKAAHARSIELGK